MRLHSTIVRLAMVAALIAVNVGLWAPSASAAGEKIYTCVCTHTQIEGQPASYWTCNRNYYAYQCDDKSDCQARFGIECE